jgi:Tfp pilus assembly protein PilF
MREGRWSEAVVTLREAATQPGTRAAVFHNLAYALERLGQHDDAREALAQALEHGGENDPRIRMSWGVLALKRGELEEADESFTTSRALFGKRTPPAAWFHYAALTAALRNDLDRAQVLVTDGLEAFPRGPVLCNTLAVLYERRGDVPAAVQAAERGLHENGSLPQLHKNLGDVLYGAGRFDEALEAYQRAIQLNPALGDDVYCKLGNIRYKWKEAEQAMAYWERALALNPANDSLRANLELVRSVPT